MNLTIKNNKDGLFVGLYVGFGEKLILYKDEFKGKEISIKGRRLIVQEYPETLTDRECKVMKALINTIIINNRILFVELVDSTYITRYYKDYTQEENVDLIKILPLVYDFVFKSLKNNNSETDDVIWKSDIYTALDKVRDEYFCQKKNKITVVDAVLDKENSILKIYFPNLATSNNNNRYLYMKYNIKENKIKYLTDEELEVALETKFKEYENTELMSKINLDMLIKTLKKEPSRIKYMNAYYTKYTSNFNTLDHIEYSYLIYKFNKDSIPFGYTELKGDDKKESLTEILNYSILNDGVEITEVEEDFIELITTKEYSSPYDLLNLNYPKDDLIFIAKSDFYIRSNIEQITVSLSNINTVRIYCSEYRTINSGEKLKISIPLNIYKKI